MRTKNNEPTYVSISCYQSSEVFTLKTYLCLNIFYFHNKSRVYDTGRKYFLSNHFEILHFQVIPALLEDFLHTRIVWVDFENLLTNVDSIGISF